ncbi:hypothetical protein P3T65_26420 [Pseudomonas nitroreducens]|nr:hypothetical protein [Pseudomonas nitroreducens]WEW97723.1 hypothetical protein P3T65_26420 [Pseudomonas nitroreducens]
MITASVQTSPHEDRLRALEERLLELVEDLHQLREDMSAQPPAEGEE